MKTKTATRYYCDYCERSSDSASHMARHEKHCTMNPERQCRVCGFLELHQKPMIVLRGCFPIKTDVMVQDEFGYTVTYLGSLKIGEGLTKLRELTENCPACILATIRQSGIPVPAVEGFDFMAEMAAAWTSFNEAHCD